MSDLYNRIRIACENKDISIAEMCRRTGIGQGTISDIKHGRQASMGAEKIDKISSVLGVSVAYLLGTEKENAPAQADKDVQEIIETLRHLDSDQREMVRAFVKTLKEMT